jgi:anti-sigma factor RsiW
MINERITELINTGLDGELGQAEQAELDSVLEASAEAREYLRELEAFSNLLDREEPLELPDGLHREIVESIELPSKSKGFSFGAIPGFIRYGMAAAAGLVLTE